MIAERLRKRNTPYGWLELVDKAADLIERLEAERVELIDALRPFAYPVDDATKRAVALNRARALLERLETH